MPWPRSLLGDSAGDVARAGPGPATKARRHEAAIKAWNKRGRKKDRGAHAEQAAAAATVSRGDWNANNTEAQRQLMSSPVVSAKTLGGGISETYVVKLASGQKANFKVSDAMGARPEKEVASWELAQLVGMEDMVPPAVVREIDVPGFPGIRGAVPRRVRGSMALWQDGEQAARLGPDAMIFDGELDLQRAAMFDHIAGNTDRHTGNWVVDKATGKIKLIDHNLTFSLWSPDSRFLSRIEDSRRLRALSPAKFIAPYVAKKNQIAAKLKATGLTDEEVNRVVQRIDRAASATTWQQLRDDERRR